MEKVKDKQFAQSEIAQMNKDEATRQQFFRRLNDIQDANDRKHEAHLKYMSQDPAALGALRDEQNYMKNMQLQQLKDQQKFKEDENKWKL